MTHRVASTCLLLSALGVSSCYSHTPVKPEQLPRLNDSFAVRAGSNMLAVRVATIEKPNGALTEVKGDFDIELQLRDGRDLTFEHPVRATLNGRMLTLQGGNRGATILDLDQVESASVVQQDGVATVLAITGISAVPLLVMVVVVAAI
jgi:hypothetical protein